MSDPEDNPISEFHKDLQSSEAKPLSAARSAADDVIEVIGDFKRPTPRAKNQCPSCSGVEIRTTYPVGAAARNLCRGCGHRWQGGPKSPVPLVLAKIGEGQQQVKGPYYRGNTPAQTPDPNQPTSRRKGRSLAALKKDPK